MRCARGLLASRRPFRAPLPALALFAPAPPPAARAGGLAHVPRRSESTDSTDAAHKDRVAFMPEEPPLLLDASKHAVGYLSRVLNARVYDVCHETPLQYAPHMSRALGAEVYLKREDQQPVFSFKLRGAYNKIRGLTSEQLARGVVACSAGNHAQGVAYSAARLNVQATIVMPVMTPAIKVDAVRAFGGPTVTVKLHGANYDEAAAEAGRLVEEEGYTLVHPFDDPEVIAGQGTIGMEILKATTGRPLDAIFVCCGGGGMLAGVAAYVKRVRPDVKVFGVEADDAAGMTESLKAGRVVTLPSVGLFADGAAVKTIGSETFRVCSELVDGMVTVSTDEICQAIKETFNDTRSVLEPAGALGVAGAKKWIRDAGAAGSHVVAITSGANVDFTRLRFVSERADASETLLAVEIPEIPGAFRKLYSHIYPRNVTEFSYRFHNGEGNANIIISFQARTGSVKQDDAEIVKSALAEAGYGVADLNGNEMAKAHVRHLAGGRSSAVTDERLVRFEFPEAPGALNNFLTKLDVGFNVSLFHYRNHGDDFGRVLVGLQVPKEENESFDAFLENLGYAYEDETGNECRGRFL